MDESAERARKASLGRQLAAMRASPAYQAVLNRIEVRCGKLWKGWVTANEEKAKAYRDIARNYLGFDQLVEEMINEGDSATKKISQGDDLESSPERPSRPGQGA